MWARLVKRLRCPLCKEPVQVSSFRNTRIDISAEDRALAAKLRLLDCDFDRYIDAGLLVCHCCKTWFPIMQGLPVLLPYSTPFHLEFSNAYQREMSQLPITYKFPNQQPAPSERFVLNSFSKEWLHYDYDGVIWELSYEELDNRFRKELDVPPNARAGLDFLEIGCGLGITTCLAYTNYKADAVGIDLSLAALRAATHYRTNPFLHFVEASVFHLPFSSESFDILYSRGVLHHTYSTQAAFKAVAQCARPLGCFYLWVYGKGSIRETPFRRMAYAAEVFTRPFLSRSPDSWFARIFLSCLGVGYLAYNSVHRLWNPETQPLNFRRAVHAARDRFTPHYAHRHATSEVVSWFQQAGFSQIQVLDWRNMPSAEREDFRRNVGVRGTRGRANYL